jgi:transketolase
MFAAHHKIDNIIATIDYNGQQIDGPTDVVMNLGSLRSKFEAFGWIVLEMNGNEMLHVLNGLSEAKKATGNSKPVCIIMHTAMGKGVSFMEGTHEWHGIAPNDKQLEAALAELPVTAFGDY